MQPHDQAALDLYQANIRRLSKDAMESLMDSFFNFPTREEYDRTLSRVSEQMSCVITNSEFSSPLSAASSSGF